MSSLKYWVWLASLPGLYNSSKLHLLQHFGDPENIYFADAEDYLQVEGLSPLQSALLADKSLSRSDEILSGCTRENLFLLTLHDAAYPARLRNIYDPPVLLYGKGKLPIFDEEAAVSVVGTRRCTPYGIRTAEALGYELAGQGALVISGLAKGIDAAAHRGALRAGGLTCAVVGGGVDVIYPEENRRLYEDIAATGVILSEYPPATEPRGSHFPARNRIISGLSVAALVVEAPEKSGALITAQAALEQGRDVFAVPGPIDAPNSRGCNLLIREGAGLVSCGEDLLENYRGRFPAKLRGGRVSLPKLPEGGAEPPAPAKAALPRLDLRKNKEGLTDDQIVILRQLSDTEPLLTDEAAEKTGIPIRRVLSALTVLEIDGYVRQDGARRFVRMVEFEDKE